MTDKYDLDAQLDVDEKKKSGANALLKRLKKASAKSTANVTMAETDFFNIDKYGADTGTYVVNLALSGKLLDGGISPGVHTIASPSATYKSLLAIQIVRAYMNKYPDGVCVFLDSEFGLADQMVALDMDMDRIIHVPIDNLESLKFEANKKLKEIEEKDNVIFLLDSLGMISSVKALNDMDDEKSTKDMTRAQVIKSFFQLITPTLNIKKIPFIVVNHTYATFDKYNPLTMGGGEGVRYASQNVIFLSKAKIKDDKSDGKTDNDLAGFKFTMTLSKSRFAKAGSKIPIFAYYGEAALDKYTGLYELAVVCGNIIAPGRGWRAPVLIDQETGEVLENKKNYRESEIRRNPEFWEEVMFKQTNFIKDVERRYRLVDPSDATADDKNMKDLSDAELFEDNLDDSN